MEIMNNKLTRAAGTAGLLLLVAGCGGSAAGTAASGSGTGAGSAGQPPASPAGGGAPASVDVCSLLSAAQASSVTGTTYTKTTSANDMCTYITTDAPTNMFIILSDGSTAADWTDQVSTVREDAGGPPQTLSAVGDKAVGGGTEIGVLSGNRIIDVHGAADNGGTFTKAIAVAKAIIAALK